MKVLNRRHQADPREIRSWHQFEAGVVASQCTPWLDDLRLLHQRGQLDGPLHGDVDLLLPFVLALLVNHGRTVSPRRRNQ